MQLVESTDGVRVAVHDLGGSGPDLLLAHATGFHGYVWAPMAAELTDGYHVVAVDFRGHGDSDVPPDGSFVWRGFRDDALAVVEALGLEHPAGVGHSMGGAALLMAELARPGTFRALVLFEPIVPPPNRPGADGDNPLVLGARRRRATFASRQEAIENYASKPPLSILTPAALDAYVQHGFADTPGGVTLKCTGEHEARIYEMSIEHGTSARLGEITCPVLVLAGDPEPGVGPADFAEPIADAIPGGRFEQLEGISHFGPMEDPARVAKLVATFLADVPAR